jgi:hypothetical protein
MNIQTDETRDDITFDFIDNCLSERHLEEWYVFLSGFEAAFKVSGLTELPCDTMMIMDFYMDFIKRRLDEEKRADEEG